MSRSSRKWARSGPCVFSTEAMDSSHSCVSTGSRSSSLGTSVMRSGQTQRAMLGCTAVASEIGRNCATKKRANDPVFTLTGQANYLTLKLERMSIRPPLDLPRIVRARSLNARTADQLDAVLVLAPENAQARTFADLPEPE